MIKDLFKLILSKYSQVSIDFRWCLWSYLKKWDKHKVSKQKWCINFTCIKLVMHVLACVCVIAPIKWRRLTVIQCNNAVIMHCNSPRAKCTYFKYKFAMYLTILKHLYLNHVFSGFPCWWKALCRGDFLNEARCIGRPFNL